MIGPWDPASASGSPNNQPLQAPKGPFDPPTPAPAPPPKPAPFGIDKVKP